MQMTVKNRVKDMIPVLIVFCIVASFGTVVFMAYVIHDPVVVTESERTLSESLPQPSSSRG